MRISMFGGVSSFKFSLSPLFLLTDTLVLPVSGSGVRRGQSSSGSDIMTMDMTADLAPGALTLTSARLVLTYVGG